MSAVRVWEPLNQYEELVGIECARKADVDRLIGAFGEDPDLRMCPRETIGRTFVVPQEAVQFLPLEGIRHKKVELVDARFLSAKVQQELARRFNARGNRKPHYYTTGRGRGRICSRFLVPLATVREIEALGA